MRSWLSCSAVYNALTAHYRALSCESSTGIRSSYSVIEGSFLTSASEQKRLAPKSPVHTGNVAEFGDSRPHDRSLSRFDTVPACDGQTDGRTDGFTIATS